MLYPNFNFNKITILERSRILWVTQKNIEVDAKWAQKKEELRREIRKNNISCSGKY